MSARKRKMELTMQSSEYKPNPRETAAVTKFLKDTAEKAPRLKVTKQGNVSKVDLDHPNNAIGRVLLMEALGTTDQDFSNEFLKQLLDATSLGGEVDEERANFMLSVIKGIKPRDQVEAMLAAQMAAVHATTMRFFPKLDKAEYIQERDSAERTLNKLMRTFVTQMEALKRYRTGGQQTVTVQHVNVGEGGQAIVGNVTQERREEAPDASPLAIEDKKTVAMPLIERPTKTPIAVPCSSKKK
jgi:hypothetical protein